MSCTHTDQLPAEVAADATDRCPDCAAIGEQQWVHLRQCLSCGHVACCDSSPHQHATTHHRVTGHPVVRSFEPGEDWRWCYVDSRLV
ncbi:UBP-type zinc finger domain-containing protein [Actinokineospora sp. G85]|uniref:UBP-type zinc finger domain-containing protein n=1 Tax=Actinokineospora sp. G85 TaxID=3406626 RepID=UPI003C78E842